METRGHHETLTKTRESGLSASALCMNDVVTGRCARMSWSELSDSGMCSVRRECASGNFGGRSKTETTWVIPSSESSDSSRAVKRSVRYKRGSTSLAVIPRPTDVRRPLRCCAMARMDVCHDGVSWNESMLVGVGVGVGGLGAGDDRGGLKQD